MAGIGPKLAFILLERGYERICSLIAAGNIKELAGVPMISQKSAKQIILQLNDKCKRMMGSSADNIEKILKHESYFKNELRDNLKKLGFQSKLIDLAIEKNEEFESLDFAIQRCIQIISHESRS